MAKSMLKEPLKIKNMTIPNRIVLPPMCQYIVDKEDGIANDWHYVHYVSRAIGGTGLIIVEATAVEPDGRITDQDLGLWNDSQTSELKRIVDAIHEQGSKVALQISHAGRKAEDAKDPVSASNVPIVIDGNTINPRALKVEEIDRIIESFVSSAKRAVEAGFDSIEIHGAHGYLIHQFHYLVLISGMMNMEKICPYLAVR